MSKYWDKKLRDIEIVKLASILTVKELAEKFKVNERTIQRALKEAKDAR